MSKYTTSIEVIISSQSNREYDLYERIKSGKKFLFDFPYPVPNDDFKESFEMQFCEKYYVECIGYETVPLFKMKLRQRLEMLMPEVIFKYNVLQDIMKMDNPALERWGESDENGINNQKSSNTSKSSVTGSGSSQSSSSASNNSKSINSDLPASIIDTDDFDDITYGSNGNASKGSQSGSQSGSQTSKSDGNSSSNSTNDTTHSIERTFKEYGNQLKSYLEYYNSYINIMQELLESFDDMFIQLLY